jgi:hypothetical protein
VYKKYFILFYLLILLSPFLLVSCDDAGVQPPPSGTTQVVLNKVFKPLDIAVDGTYELFLITDSSYITYGKFNLDNNGNPVDLYGNSKPLVFPEIYKSKINSIVKAWLTIEPPEDTDTLPSASVLVAGNFINYEDSISASLNVNHTDALGSVGDVLLTGIRSRYMCYNKTMPDSGNCFKGLWFCDSTGTSYFQQGLDLTSNNGWTYQGWLVNKTSGAIYSMGKFSNPDIADMDAAGNCAGPAAGFNAPGQEWQLPGCADITNLQNSNFRIMVTIEPKFEIQGFSGSLKPFFFYPYFEHTIQPVGCAREGQLYNAFNFPDLGFPKIQVRIAKGT